MKQDEAVKDGAAAPGRGMRWALTGSAVLLAAALAAFYLASRHAGERGGDDGAVDVTVYADRCEPQALTVPAGTVGFRILNRSERAVEWEILDGVMVVEERENIAPGFTQSLRARLEPGDYAITCGLLTNPRGTLHVTPSAEYEAAARARPALADFVGALAEYRVYLAIQAGELEQATGELARAVSAGRLDEARALYVPARQAYQRMETAADLYADLDVRMDGKADYFARREQDPGFGGFHRLEYGLFAQDAGLSGQSLEDTARQLHQDAGTLRERVRSLKVPPQRMASAALRLARDMAAFKTSGGEDPYSHTDLYTLQANLQGLHKVAALLQPVAARRDGELARRLEHGFARVQAGLDAQGHAGRFPSYGQVDPSARKELAAALQALADELAGMNAALGW